MKGTKTNGNSRGMKHYHLPWGFEACVCFLFLALQLVGCAPQMYRVNMRYISTDNIGKLEKVVKPATITVAAFKDLRGIRDDILIGRVIKPDGTTIPVLPRFMTPPQAVTIPFKEFFREAGYTVSTESPVWDLKETTIRKEWGDILVGGSIDELEVVCMDSLIRKKYKAKVKLTVLFANTKTGKVFYRVTTESLSSLDTLFEDRLEQQINVALSGAIEKIFEDKKIASAIGEAMSYKP